MYTYNFLFLCFSHNPFLHGILACIVNFYQQTRMDRPTDKVRYKSSLPELKKFWVQTCVLTTLIFYVLLTIKLFGAGFKNSYEFYSCISTSFLFLCFAPNPFLHGVLVNVEHFYRPINRRTKWDIEAPCQSFKNWKSFNFWQKSGLFPQHNRARNLSIVEHAT